MSEKPKAQADYETPYYAHFEHPDGSWYLLWVTHTQPQTARGHPWHVHASFDKQGGEHGYQIVQARLPERYVG